MILEIVLALVKILIIIGFCLNFSAIAVWADRRQSAMIQHRVGPPTAPSLPDRAFIIQGVLAAPGLLIGAAVVLGSQAAEPAGGPRPHGLSLQCWCFSSGSTCACSRGESIAMAR